MNKCINCGNYLIPGDKFCRKCGTPINNQNSNQMVNNNMNFTNNINTQMPSNNTGYNNQYVGNFNNNLNSNINMNNNQGTVTQRKDNLSTLVIIIVVLVIGILFILFMPAINKTDNGNTIVIKDNNSTTNNEVNNNTNNNVNNNTTNNNNSNNNNNNNSSSNPNVKKDTLSFKGVTINKRSDYKYTFSTQYSTNMLIIENANSDDAAVIEGVYKTSIKDINSKTSVIKNQYKQSGYQTGTVKYTTYKNKKIYTIEISQNSYKMLAGYYEIDSGVVVSFILYDKNYTRYNYDGYAFIANIFDKSTVSSSIKNGMSYEIKGDFAQIVHNFLTKQ